MLIKEYRIVLPLTVEEYRVGQLYNIIETSRESFVDGDKIETIKDEDYDHGEDSKYSKGNYTHKVYKTSSKVPSYLSFLASRACLEVHEECWNCYPFTKTILTNPKYMKDNFIVRIESYYATGKGELHNVHDLAPDVLSKREVVFINIAADPVDANDYRQEYDPRCFYSRKTDRGLLEDNWMEMAGPLCPIMCCYKLVFIEFKKFGFQTRVEALMQSQERKLFLVFNRRVFCTIDKWCDLTMEELKNMQKEVCSSETRESFIV